MELVDDRLLALLGDRPVHHRRIGGDAEPAGAILGKTATIARSHLIPAELFGAPLFDGLAHRFTVRVDAGLSDWASAELDALVEREKPAHTLHVICETVPGISSGGSRVGISRAYLNVFMVMAISGLWHGADWNFIFWGALHGAFLLLEKYLFSFPAIKSRYDKIPLGIRNFYTFFVFAIAILFFRAKPLPDYGSSISVGFYIFNNLFTLKEGIAPAFPATIVALSVVLFVIEGIQVNRPKWIEENALFNHPVFQIALCGGLLGIAFIIYSVTVSQQFIYFQF